MAGANIASLGFVHDLTTISLSTRVQQIFAQEPSHRLAYIGTSWECIASFAVLCCVSYPASGCALLCFSPWRCSHPPGKPALTSFVAELWDTNALQPFFFFFFWRIAQIQQFSNDNGEETLLENQTWN